MIANAFGWTATPTPLTTTKQALEVHMELRSRPSVVADRLIGKLVELSAAHASVRCIAA